MTKKTTNLKFAVRDFKNPENTTVAGFLLFILTGPETFSEKYLKKF
jgi:hypothetical protein